MHPARYFRRSIAIIRCNEKWAQLLGVTFQTNAIETEGVLLSTTVGFYKYSGASEIMRWVVFGCVRWFYANLVVIVIVMIYQILDWYMTGFHLVWFLEKKISLMQTDCTD